MSEVVPLSYVYKIPILASVNCFLHLKLDVLLLCAGIINTHIKEGKLKSPISHISQILFPSLTLLTRFVEQFLF